VHIWLFLQALLALVTMTPEQKARFVVVTTERPGIFTGASGIRFADQEGGLVKALPDEPPWRSARETATAAEARAAGWETRRALRRAGIDVDLAPVLDASDGPLGSRQFNEPSFGVAFARGLGDAACPKHFPGLGSAAVSTDARPHVDARIRPQDLAPFRAAIRAGVRCVMVGHAFYGDGVRASLDPAVYARLRALGFGGVAITDSLSIMRAAPVEQWARRAARAGADLLLVAHPGYAERAVRALVPLARRGELDTHVLRVLRFRRQLETTTR
jgi:beta-N-acetylhexosaminidase